MSRKTTLSTPRKGGLGRRFGTPVPQLKPAGSPWTSSIDNKIEESHPRSDDDYPSQREGVIEASAAPLRSKIQRWWSTPFREWLPWALPFVGGIAFHELQDVPAYPASHGCVRQSFTVARWTYDFATIGMPVKGDRHVLMHSPWRRVSGLHRA
jgi:hypothetical protein